MAPLYLTHVAVRAAESGWRPICRRRGVGSDSAIHLAFLAGALPKDETSRICGLEEAGGLRPFTAVSLAPLLQRWDIDQPESFLSRGGTKAIVERDHFQ